MGDLTSSFNALNGITDGINNSFSSYVLNTNFISSNTTLISCISTLDTHISVNDEVLANFQIRQNNLNPTSCRQSDFYNIET